MSVNNSPELVQSSSLKHTSSWRLIYGGSVADGAITEIYSVANFLAYWHREAEYVANVAAPSATNRGRMLIATHGGDSLELFALFSTNAATCTIQPWAFDFTKKHWPNGTRNDLTTDSSLLANLLVPSQGDLNLALNLPYNLARDVDPTSATITMTARAEQVNMAVIRPKNDTVSGAGIGAEFVPVVDVRDVVVGGAPLYQSARLRLRLNGLPAAMVTVAAISAGTVFILGRISGAPDNS